MVGLVEEVFALLVEDVDREADDTEARDVRTVVVRIVEELFDTRLVDELVVVVMTASIQEHALRIFDGSALQPELIDMGVTIAVFVVYTLQNEDAAATSEFIAF